MKRVEGELESEFESELRAAAAADLASATPPDSGHVWRVAQLRARREAVKTAGRPITAIQVMATGCAFGLLGACFGATSAWFQAVVGSITARLASFEFKGALSSATALFMEHDGLVVAIVALLLLIPGAFYLALQRD